MLREILRHPGALIIAIAIHLLVVMVFVVSFNWSEPPAVQEMGIPIELIQELPLLASTQPKKHNEATKATENSVETISEQNTIKPVIDHSAEVLATKKVAEALAQKQARLKAQKEQRLEEKQKATVEKLRKEKIAKELAKKKS
ncbi:MAG: hypothetical protein KAH03_07120, partial [Cocleimonas sp.]|nr:hypothetical protein [Cocleimonas sp.]